MKTANFRIAGAIIALSLTVTATIVLAQDPTTEARNLLIFCKAHPEACSISIDYVKGSTGYSIDYNGTRLNPVASTVKIIHLLAYADAVDKNKIHPAQQVDLDEWGRFFIGQDGGALDAAYKRLGSPPNSVTNDQIVSAMIQESDNAAPDYLLNKLGSDFMDDTVKRYVTGGGRGYMDTPQSINAMFDSWTAGPRDPLIGQRSLNNFSGYESDEYRDVIDDVFEQMHHHELMDALRDYNGVKLPWIIGPLPVPEDFPINESQYETLEKNYSTRSNTRTYNLMMLGLLNRSLLPARAQAIVESFLEFKLKQVPLNPLLVNAVRYGSKDGSFAAYNGVTVRTRSIYVQMKDGTEVAFTVHLTGTPGTPTDLGPTDSSPGSLDLAVRDFAIAVATDPAFAVEVQTKLGTVQDALAPSLVARIVSNKSTRNDVRLKVEISNIGTAPTIHPLQAALYFSNDGTTLGAEVDHKPIEPLQPGQSIEVELNSRSFGTTKFFVLDIDPTNQIPAVQKQNNPQFEIAPGH
jgi:beta-lactamase class A